MIQFDVPTWAFKLPREISRDDVMFAIRISRASTGRPSAWVRRHCRGAIRAVTDMRTGERVRLGNNYPYWTGTDSWGAW